MPLWQSNNLLIMLCHQSFLLHCLSLTCRKLLPFLKSILFFSYDFKNIKHLVTLVNSNAASREPLIIFVALMVSLSIWLKSLTVAICQMDSISFIHTATPVLAPTMLECPISPQSRPFMRPTVGRCPLLWKLYKAFFWCGTLRKEIE